MAKHRQVALILALFEMAAVAYLAPANFLAGAIVCGIALGLIFGAETLSAFRGNVGRGGIVDSGTPGWMFVVFGWLILLLVIAVTVIALLREMQTAA